MISSYTYLIGWSQHDKWYYGVRYARGCDPSDLWVTYFTSSTYVHQFVEEFGPPDVVEVRKTFETIDSGRQWEERVLKRMRVVHNKRWLNKHDIKSFEPLYGDKNPMRRDDVHTEWLKIVQSDEHREKLKLAWSDPSVREKISGENHYSKIEGWVSPILGDNHPMKNPEIVKKAMANRDVTGERNGRTKLTVEQVNIIKNKKIWEWGDLSRMATEMNVSRHAINLIRRGINWAYNTED